MGWEENASAVNKQCMEQKCILLAYIPKTRKAEAVKAGYSLGCSGHEMKLRIPSGGNKMKSRIRILDLK